MKYTFTLLLVLIIRSVNAQELRSLNFDRIHEEIMETKDTLIVCNFWATWCKPCITELPYFEKMHNEFSSQPVKILLINLDFSSRLNNSVIPFIKKRAYNSEIVHLKDPDPNEWINKVDSNWSGAIPATIMYHSGSTLFFHEGELSEDYLRKTINDNLKSVSVKNRK
jgi:thiol-disulfide isomerase/thioredoxin